MDLEIYYWCTVLLYNVLILGNATRRRVDYGNQWGCAIFILCVHLLLIFVFNKTIK